MGDSCYKQTSSLLALYVNNVEDVNEQVKIAMTTYVKSNRERKIYCAIVVILGAVSLFGYHLAVKDRQQKWLTAWQAMKVSDISHRLSNRLALEKLLSTSKSLRYELYTDLKKALAMMRNQSTNSTEISPSTSFPRKILILSRGRSGSSFLGDLFNENEEVFYLFEPLKWSVNVEGIDTKKLKILDDIYNCKFTDERYLKFLMEEKFFRRKSKKLATFPGQCSRISRSSQRCLSNILKSSCTGANSVMTKVLTHRLPQGGLWGIKEVLDANKNLRIVHLIRDPRRVIASMKNAGWFKGKNFTVQVEYICSAIWENVQHVRNESVYYKDRYKLLIFSDMMLSPFSTVVELYDFLKIGAVPEYIFSWIIQNTMGAEGETRKRKSSGTYRTFRNSTEVLYRTVDFSKFEEKIIDTYCDNVTKLIATLKKNSMY